VGSRALLVRLELLVRLVAQVRPAQPGQRALRAQLVQLALAQLVLPEHLAPLA
jgi:hypothetical protein